jgi:hypothetical protein
MIRATVDTTGLDRLIRRAEALRRVDYTPLMNQWAQLLVRDNAAAARAGTDRDGKPLVRTVREMSPALSRRKGSGKPLAPRTEASRLIRWARGRAARLADGTYAAVLYWTNFTTHKGRSILAIHKAGIRSRRGKIVRDVLGVRPATKGEARRLLRDFLTTIIRGR